MASDDRRDRLFRAGEWLRTQRERRSLSAAQLAKLIGVSRSVLSNYERGINEAPDEVADKIAEVFRINIIDARRGLGLWVPAESSSERPEQGQPSTDDEWAEMMDEIRELSAQVIEGLEARRDKREAERARAVLELFEPERESGT